MKTGIIQSSSFSFLILFFSSDIAVDIEETFNVTENMIPSSQVSALSEALTFHASFDEGPDADFGKGDKKIYSGNFKGSRAQDEIPTTSGLGTPPLSIVKEKGKYGDALEFKKDNSHVVFYKLEKNIQYAEKDFKGTLSLWMNLDPSEIPEKYCDPLQITDKYYASDAIWIDITKNDVPPDLRLGVLGDERVWDVSKRQGASEEFFWHLLKISDPPFQKGKWTHVVVTWDLNGSDIGTAKLYLDGQYRGRSGPIREPFRWDVSKVTMRLGTGHYIGLMDDIALFHKALTADEVKTLYNLKTGASELHP